MDNNLPNTQIDDQKMENLRKRTKLSKYIMIAGGVCLGIIVLMILLNGGTLSLNFKTPTGVVAIILIIGGFALLFMGLRVKQKASEAQKHIANNYARSVLDRVMDRLDTFDHGKHIDMYYLNQDFGFPKYDCTGFCGDYVRGVLRGVPMEFCEFELQEKHVTEDKDGDTDVSYETVFYGVIVVCRHNLALSDAVVATQFKTYEKMRLWQRSLKLTRMPTMPIRKPFTMLFPSDAQVSRMRSWRLRPIICKSCWNCPQREANGLPSAFFRTVRCCL